MSQHLSDYILNATFSIVAVLVIFGWLRNRTARYRDVEIDKREISADLTAGDELLQDVLSERSRSEDARLG